MRSTKFVVLAAALLTAALLFTPSSKAQGTQDDSSGPRGSVPRSSADRYHSHAQSDGTSVGAQILTLKQVQKAFVVSDLNHCCIVVEFAFYPGKGKDPHDLSLDDFALYISGSDIGTKPQSATVVAASLQKKAGSGPPVSVHGGTTVGYESGTYTDPNTGQSTRVHGVYTGTEVNVSDPKPAPGSTAKNWFSRCLKLSNAIATIVLDAISPSPRNSQPPSPAVILFTLRHEGSVAKHHGLIAK
jgi:hypothetical protein